MQRTVATDIWYPGREAQPIATQSRANAAPNGPPNNDATHPLVIFSHGNQGTPSNNSVFLSHLASHGFVVAAPQHQDCQTNCTQTDYADETTRRPLDVQSVLDNVLSLSSTDDAILGKLVDPTRVGVAGQSFGGWTALEALQNDARFRAALVMNATTQVPFADPTKVSKPLLMMAGELDALVPFAVTERFFSRLPSTQDRFLLVVPRAGHEFDNECFAAALTVSCAAALPQEQLLGVINRVGTAFLNRYVANEPATSSGSVLDATDTPDYTLVSTSAGVSPQLLPTAAPAPAGPTPAATAPAIQPGTVLLTDELRTHQPGSYQPAAAIQVGIRRVTRMVVTTLR